MTSTNSSPDNSRYNWFLLLSLGLIWGGSFPAVEYALVGFGPLSIVGLRVGMAAIVLLALAYANGDGLPKFNGKINRRIWMHALGLAVFSNALPFALLSWGQLYVTSSFAGISMAVVPLLILPLAHIFLPDEKMSPRKLAGLSVGFAGVAVLIGPGIFSSNGTDIENLARLASVTAALCYAIGSIITRLCPKVPLIGFSAAALLLASLINIPIALYFEGLPQNPGTIAIVGVIYLGLIPTAVATLLLVRIIRTAGPSFLSLVNYQVPVWAVLIGTTLLAEPLPSQFLGALGLILAGLAISRAKAWRRFRP